MNAGSGLDLPQGDSGAPLRIAVLGTGRIGRLHAGLLAREVPGAQLAAVSDVNAESARVCAAELGVPAVSVDDILADPNIDAVAVCSSTDTHVDLSVQAAKAGKAVFCEKPLSLDLLRVDEVLTAVATAGVPFMVGFNRRFDPAHQAVRDAVRAGDVGEVHLVRITSRDPEPPPPEYVRVSGGIFLDMTIHDFDMARYITGSEVIEVYARGEVRVDPKIGLENDVDTAVIMLTHADRTITVIDNSRQAVYGYDQRVEAFGSGGMAMSENPRTHSAVVVNSGRSSAPALPWFFLDRYLSSYRREWAAFVDYVRDGGDSPVPGSAGRAPIAIGLAAWRSVREGRPVRLEEIG
ncbi:MAG TPA: inositol 2-dehydrogenase [Kineosporiaceae bacterium]|nr:inositol 2-dehydrogenase [Kineosporiaceae bacterium]